MNDPEILTVVITEEDIDEMLRQALELFYEALAGLPPPDDPGQGSAK